MITLGFILFTIIILTVYCGCVLLAVLYQIFDDNTYRTVKIKYTFENIVKEFVHSPEEHLLTGLVIFLIALFTLFVLGVFYEFFLNLFIY